MVDAGAWVRVSSGGQDEANQIPDIERYGVEHGYRYTKWYVLNDKSASKGKQQVKLDEMLTDMRLGVIPILVCWHSDRLERRGPEALFRLLRQADEAGGRIESIKEPLLGAPGISGEAMTAIGAIVAHQKSVHLSEQVRLSHERIRENGALMGYAPWGYVIVGEKYNKTLVPTEICRKYAPQIFQRKIDGLSLYSICEWLDTEGVPPVRGQRWNAGSLYQIIQNMTYAGRRQDEGPAGADGKTRRKNRRTVMRCEAVVSFDMWRRANEALHASPRRGPGVRGTLPNRPLLASLRCARCEDSPMYRIRSGDGKYYYRCFGRAPRRKGCGNMVPLDQVDTIITARILVWSDKPYQIQAWAEGINWDTEIEDVKQSLVELAREMRGDYTERHAALMADLANYMWKNEHEAVKGHWEYTDTGMTIGEYFYALSDDGKRSYLKSLDIRVEKATPDDPGATRGVRVVIDGEGHGVFAYPA